MTTMQPGSTYAAVVGAVITQLRNKAGVSQADLARAVGIGQPAWSRIEKGESALTIDQLARAAQRVGQTPGQILDIADNTATSMKQQKLVVSYEKPQRPDKTGTNAGLLFLGGAALAALIISANKSK